MRFLRDPDRWTSFASVLLKSLAFHRSVDPTIGMSSATNVMEGNPSTIEILQLAIMDDNEKKLPIVDLPRTKYNRPYLPQLDGQTSSPSNGTQANGGENRNSVMNVSHQYPWICMAQQQLDSTATKDTPSKPTTTLLLGVDLVIFSARLGNYETTVDEFLKSFKNSFTPWEWEMINHRRCPSSWWSGRKVTTRARTDESKLKEFFLRWSMKEAYTKALGLGMHINFDEFETRLDGVDVNVDDDAYKEQDEGIWTSIMKNEATHNLTSGKAQHQFSVIGKVKCIKPKVSRECWQFIFIPLRDGIFQDGYAQESEPSQLRGKDLSYNACACICRGPLAKSAMDAPTTIYTPTLIESMTLVDLIKLHGGSQF